MNNLVYLAGEIHTQWRNEITGLCEALELDIQFSSPITNHKVSDDIGKDITGVEDKSFWNDYKSARLNQARNKVLLEKSNVVIVRFGERYKQWNSAFDAGFAVAHNKPLVTWHDECLDHALKEIDSAAVSVTRNVEQVVKSLAYICCGRTL